jgi:pyruvate dehydrogenase E2 component (dihydrolipoyllysine-residue acetyltransferase)
MASRVVMPKLTDTMEEGIVVEWKKKEGDPVQAGDVIAEIETDKAVMDLEAFASGILRKVMAREGETVKAGALIGVIGEADEDITAAASDSIAASAAVKTASPKAPPPVSRAAGGSRTEEPRTIASPRAKALAAERGIDLSTVQGTGPEGRIVEDDVVKAAGVDQTTMPAGTDQPLSQMRKAIARATSHSKAPVPHFYLTVDIAMEKAEQFRNQFKQDRRVHPSITDLIIKTAALALARHPQINVSYTGTAIRRYATIDIGIVVGLDDGLISPVLKNCGAKSLEQISTESRELIERARSKRLQPPEYAGATFSISNLGMYDVANFIAVLMPPQAACIAVSAVRDAAVVENGGVRAGRRMSVTLSCDHRALDGMQAAQFLKEFKRMLEHPQELTKPGTTL